MAPYISNRVNAEATLEMLANARDPEYWNKQSGFVDRFDPGWCISLLYDHTDTLTEQDSTTLELIRGTLYDSEFSAAAQLREIWDPMVEQYREHDSDGHLTDPRWPEVERRSAELLRLMRVNDEGACSGT